MTLTPGERAELSATREKVLENFNDLLTRRKYLEASLILEDAVGISKMLGEMDKVDEYNTQIEMCIAKLKDISEEIHVIRADPDLREAFIEERSNIIAQAQKAAENNQHQESCELYRNAVEISLKLEDKKSVWKLSKTITLIEQNIQETTQALTETQAVGTPRIETKTPTQTIPEVKPPEPSMPAPTEIVPSVPEIKPPTQPAPFIKAPLPVVPEIKAPMPPAPAIQAPLPEVAKSAPKSSGIDDLVPTAPVSSGIEDLVPTAPASSGIEDLVPTTSESLGIDDLVPKTEAAVPESSGIDDLIPQISEVEPITPSSAPTIGPPKAGQTPSKVEIGPPKAGQSPLKAEIGAPKAGQSSTTGEPSQEEPIFHLPKEAPKASMPAKKEKVIPFFTAQVEEESTGELFTEVKPEMDKKTKKKWELAEKIALKKLEQAEKDFEKKAKKEEKEAAKEEKKKKKEDQDAKKKAKKDKGSKDSGVPPVGRSGLAPDVLAEIRTFKKDELENVGAPSPQKKVVGGRSLLPPDVLAELKKKSEEKE